MSVVKQGSLTKNQRRRLNKKLAKQHKTTVNESSEETSNEKEIPSSTLPVDVEYVSVDLKEELALPDDDPMYIEFMRIFSKFSSAEELVGQKSEEGHKEGAQQDLNALEVSDSDEIKSGKEEAPLSRKQRKNLKRLSVAELKQLVAFPDVVEAHDVTAADPRFLVYLKSYRNTVPVPRHWSNKRKYLQGKRGVEKKPFLLPDFIANTGIAEVRGVDIEEDAKRTLKQKSRERMQPKMGRIDIDYQVLHDAFFRYQTKPEVSILGDLYYEGKEFEVKLKSKIPGLLSNELKNALGMVDGVPPPWLLNMQRYGPPPAYPNLKIPGLNCPIPEGSSFGYHPGGWGKPPVDESGQPLYGDVFGKAVKSKPRVDGVVRERWGEIEQVEEPEEDEEEEEEEEEQETEDTSFVAAPSQLDATGMDTPLTDGISSATSGVTTPGVVDLRKGFKKTATPDHSQQLYTVLAQEKTAVGSALYGSAHAYVVPSSTTAGTESTVSVASSTTSTKSGRVRRRFENVEPTSTDDTKVKEQESETPSQKSKKAKSEKSKKHKEFKF